MPPQFNVVRQRFNYDPMTGLFTWRIGRANCCIGDIVGTIHRTGYRHIKIDGRKYQSSNVVWLWVHGVWPDLIDHINGDRRDDRIFNLRLATESQNCANRPAMKNNKCGEKGVHWRERDDRKGVWVAQIKFQGRVLHIGHYSAKEDAKLAYDARAIELFGEFARL